MKNNRYHSLDGPDSGWLSDVTRQMPFVLEEDYFTKLPGEIQLQVQHEQFVASLPENTPYVLKNNYFEEFGIELLEQIREESPGSRNTHMPYQVPDDYFKQLPSSLTKQLNLTYSSFRIWVNRLSLAASVILFMGLALYQLWPNANQDVKHSCEQQLAALPDEVVIDYYQTYQEEIAWNLSLEPINLQALDLQQLESEVYTDALKDISEEELLNYVL